MSGGGGTQTTVQKNDPWGPAQPYLTDTLRRAGAVANQPAQYFPGPLTIGPTQAENQNWGTQGAYNQNVFGGTPSLQFDPTAQAYSGQLQGGAYGSLLPGLTGNAASALDTGFAGGPSTVGRYGFDASINPGANGPQFGQAGGLDATSYYRNALQGTPDYAGVQGAIDAANAPILRNFQNDILPQLNTRATFLNNSTGGIKALNTVLPEIGRQMGENAQNITNQERLRAFTAQQQAAGDITQGGMQGYGLGLQQQQAQAGAGQNLAQLNLATDQANAGLAGDWRSQALGYGGLAGQLAGGASQNTNSALGMAPDVFGLQAQPLTTNQNYANYDRTLQEQQLAAQQQRFNYLRDYPQNQTSWYGNLASQIGGMGGTGSQTSNTSQNMGTGDWLSAGLGALALFSDRRLKTDIEPVGKLDSGLPVYRYRYKGSPLGHIGVMADEAQTKFPEAVSTHTSGYQMVDYAQVA